MACEFLPAVATALLHNCSTFSDQEEPEIGFTGAIVSPDQF